jgi:hypothetical protein
MKRTRAIGLFGLVAIAALAIAQGDALKKTAKVGDVVKYHSESTFSYQGQDGTVTLDLTDKVTAVDADGTLTVTKGTDNMKVNVGGQDVQVPESPKMTVKYAPNGEPIDVTGDDQSGSGHREETLSMIHLPDKAMVVGDTWDFKKTNDHGFIPIKGTYKVEAAEKVGDVDTLKVKATLEETEGDAPVKSDGYLWIDVKTGWTVKSDLQVTNFPTPVGPMDMHIVATRQ